MRNALILLRFIRNSFRLTSCTRRLLWYDLRVHALNTTLLYVYFQWLRPEYKHGEIQESFNVNLQVCRFTVLEMGWIHRKSRSQPPMPPASDPTLPLPLITRNNSSTNPNLIDHPIAMHNQTQSQARPFLSTGASAFGRFLEMKNKIQDLF